MMIMKTIFITLIIIVEMCINTGSDELTSHYRRKWSVVNDNDVSIELNASPREGFSYYIDFVQLIT
jgi:hypothetical protein